MREILFRGFYPNENGSVVIVVNGQEVRGDWFEGYYVLCRKRHYILQQYDNNGYDDRGETCEWKEVIPETVGQYTGLTDKNGVKIFEGDILRVKSFWEKSNGAKIEIVNQTKRVVEKGETVWSVKYVNHRNFNGFKVYGIDRRWSGELHQNRVYNSEAVVIGNIHDKGENNETKNN